VTARWLFRVALLMGLAAAAANAEEAPPRIFHIGIVAGTPRSMPWHVAFEDRLRELDYVEGRNLVIDFIQDSDLDHLAAAVGEFARRGVDVIVVGQDTVMKAAIIAARSTPVVFRAVDFDPLAKGYIASLAHPGGNLTGVVFEQPELIAKRLDLLTQAVPNVARIILLYDVASEDQQEVVSSAALALGVPLQAIELHSTPYDYEHALAGTDGARGDALTMTVTPFGRPEAAAEAALRHHLPSIGLIRRWAEAGSLMSYGPNISDMFRISADYVDKILKGAKPADLPVQQPTKFELVINLKTQSVRADDPAGDPRPRRRGHRMSAHPTRRAVLFAAAVATLGPRAGWGQESGRTYRLGILSGGEARQAPGWVVFFDEMGKAGFVEGRNLIVDWRFLGSPDQTAAAAAELVQLAPTF
jgi:putative ABC transport system substrate-binding protein